jgi:hypothetical protein
VVIRSISYSRSIGQVQVIDHRWRGGDQVDFVFALQPVADDLQMQQPQEAAAETEPQRRRGLHLVAEAGVVQGQFLDGVAQVLEFRAVDREQAAEDHRLGGLEAGQRGLAALLLVGDGVADAGVADLLDAGGQEAKFAGAEDIGLGHLRGEHADPVDAVDRLGRHHADALALLQHTVDDAHQHDDTQIGVVPAVDQHRLQGGVAVAGGRRQAGDHGFQHILDAEAGLGRDQHRVRGIDTDHVLDLLGHPFGFGRRQVDLVEDRDDLVIGLDGLVDIGQRLGLDPLRGIDHQQRALDGAHRA